ncbi:MAG: DUF4834 family protein [Bacteroidales bacterium]
MEFLYFLIIVIGIVIFFRIFFRLIFPWILARWMKKKQKEFFDMFGQRPEEKEKEKKREGEVNIDYVPEEDEAAQDPSLGEYVDFEEVDDGNEDDEEDESEK